MGRTPFRKVKTRGSRKEHWVYTGKLKKVAFRGGEHRPYVDVWWHDGSSFPGRAGWYTQVAGKSGFTRVQRYFTKREALAAGLKFRRTFV